jgi:hypothetical protein
MEGGLITPPALIGTGLLMGVTSFELAHMSHQGHQEIPPPSDEGLNMCSSSSNRPLRQGKWLRLPARS